MLLDLSEPLIISSFMGSVLVSLFILFISWRSPLAVSGVILGAGRFLSGVELFSGIFPVYFYLTYALAISVFLRMGYSLFVSPRKLAVLKTTPVLAYLAYWGVMISVFLSFGQLEGGSGVSRIRHFFVYDFVPITAIIFSQEERKSVEAFLSAVFHSLLILQGLVLALILPKILSGVDVYTLRYISILGTPFFSSSNILFLFLGLAYAFSGRTRAGVLLGWISVFLSLSVIFLAQSRLPIIGAVVLSPYLLAHLRISARKIFWISTALVLLFVGAAVVNHGSVANLARDIVFARFVEKAHGSDDGLLSGRTQLWEQAFDSFLESPLVGKGMGNATEALYQQDYLTGSTSRILYRPGAHNFLLETLGENGLLGMGFVVAFVFLVSRVVVRLRSVPVDSVDYLPVIKAAFFYSLLVSFVGGPDYLFVAGFLGVTLHLRQSKRLIGCPQ